ncbi:tape measure protein, partial [Aeromonas veronii]|uniref:tape measure protein n=1 Tax=Aeromonas veronii TaxID=654 RepID=UPI00406C4047
MQELLQLTNVWTDLKSRVDLAAGSVEKGTDVMGRLGEMASRTYSSLEQTAESYLLNARTLTELGYSTKTQLDYT